MVKLEALGKRKVQKDDALLREHLVFAHDVHGIAKLPAQPSHAALVCRNDGRQPLLASCLLGKAAERLQIRLTFALFDEGRLYALSSMSEANSAVISGEER